MPYYKFKEEDVFHNVMVTHPKNEFKIFSVSGSNAEFRIVHNALQPVSGAFTDNVVGTTPGSLSLYEINVDKKDGQNDFIYPFVTKEGGHHALKTVGSGDYWNSGFGDTITGSYNLSASLYREYWIESENGTTARKHLSALRNVLNYYKTLSPHYEFSNSKWNKQNQKLNLISIPSMFYGKCIKKGTVDLHYYVTGTLVGRLRDEKQNGELIQTGPAGSEGSGSVAGVVLYNEGFLVLTGSWTLNAEPKDYINSGSDTQLPSTWLQYGAGIPGKIVGDVTGSHYVLDFKGTNPIPTVTMLAYAKANKVNASNNPTFVKKVDKVENVEIMSGSTLIKEDPQREIYNSVDTKYLGTTGSFERQTFITKIKIFDEYMNCIGEAKLARPVKKTEARNLMFKLKLDF